MAKNENTGGERQRDSNGRFTSEGGAKSQSGSKGGAQAGKQSGGMAGGKGMEGGKGSSSSKR